MPWIQFTRTFLWKHVRVQGTLYKEGMTVLVTTPCAHKAIAIGAAILVDRPQKAERLPYGYNNKKSRKADKKA